MKPIIFEGICERVDSSLSGDDAEVRLRIDGQKSERATIHVSGDFKDAWIRACHPCVDNWVVGRRLRIVVHDVTDDDIDHPANKSATP